MIKIDLLKGQGLPVRSNPTAIAVITLLFMVPTICGLAMATQYLHNRSEIVIQEKALQKLDEKAAAVNELHEFQQANDTLSHKTNACIMEVADIMPRYNQWSPLLAAIAEHLPQDFVLNELEVVKKMKSVEVPRKGEPGQKSTISIPTRTLRICVYHNDTQLNDAEVQEFIEKLQSDQSLWSQVQEFRLVGHQLETVDEQEMTRYDIDAILKTAY